ncbi:hypothetical protein BDW02DRAFT_597726 [Decorospora gaudefroyi]|uniref:Uncharacterized protein n=1 Tax=Decorospora gaudefroyi TaxID=184978 RepID=A0A6A5KKR9_9PLEO|nr:hypothetical protein BDW02DRAFT_597726 [Decorospora gaudefroyi]
MNKVIVEEFEGPFTELSGYSALSHWAFEHLSSESVILQFLVHSFCDDWYEQYDKRKDVEALLALPPAFVARVMRRYSENGKMMKERLRLYERGETGRIKKKKDCCYLEHESEEEKKSCSSHSLHMQYDKERDYGYFD